MQKLRIRIRTSIETITVIYDQRRKELTISGNKSRKVRSFKGDKVVQLSELRALQDIGVEVEGELSTIINLIMSGEPT